MNRHHSIDSIMKRFEYNEKAYIDSLNLSELKKSMIKSLKKSIKCIHKLEQRRDGPEDQGRKQNLAISEPEIQMPSHLNNYQNNLSIGSNAVGLGEGVGIDGGSSLDDQIRNVPFNPSSCNNTGQIKTKFEGSSKGPVGSVDLERKFEFDFKSIQEIEHTMWYVEEFDKRFTGFVEHLSDLSTYIQRKEFFFNKQLKVLTEQYQDKQHKQEEQMQE